VRLHRLPTSRSKDAPPPQPLRPLVAAGTPLPYAGPVASGQGGRNQEDDGGLQRPTFQSSDVLTQRALAMFPPAVQSAFANQKIERPADTSEIYGAPSRSVNIGGGYWPGSGKIALGRGIEQTSGPNDAVNGTMHEILHAISHTGEGFAQDESAGYPELTAALFDGLPALLANPVTRVRAEEAAQKITTDPSHSFTAIGDLYIHGAQLPAQLKAYFDQMRDYRPAGEQLEGAAAVEKVAVAPPRSCAAQSVPGTGKWCRRRRCRERTRYDCRSVPPRWWRSGAAGLGEDREELPGRDQRTRAARWKRQQPRAVAHRRCRRRVAADPRLSLHRCRGDRAHRDGEEHSRAEHPLSGRYGWTPKPTGDRRSRRETS
jgi:hypothetical protein